ncbi:MAG: DUF4070 domain-containing protein [Bacteroidales bacterium]|nr:DUF4070 domain-containing protein [Bacteroidales bacterium]
MNILLINPKFPNTYWSFKHALKFISKKSLNVPLGLITVASLLPKKWNRKLIDMNVSGLKEQDVAWADYVFISAMSVQSASAHEIIRICRSMNTKTVAGGPLFTEECEQFPDVDHLVLNEAEITLPLFIEDLTTGKAKGVYRSEHFADLTTTPLPDYSLLQLHKYAMAGIQYSRGCPFDCEFCDITALFGHRVRTKKPGQIIRELDALYNTGWRGHVFFVDDNFIGHRNKLKKELLPEMIRWMEKRQRPFVFTTEASINLADDQELMGMMVRAGFHKVFVGIESPEEICLTECNKVQNHQRNLLKSVTDIQQAGMEVTAGFIVGFDSDPVNIFQRQIEFIQQSGIITAMVGLLNAPRLSKLYRRLHQEGRIVSKFSGDNTDYSMNFIPVMDKEMLLKGYQKILQGIYSSKAYYERVLTFLKSYNPPFREQKKITLKKLSALFKSMMIIGIFNKNSKYYWKLLIWSLLNKPSVFPLAVTYCIYGYHFRKVFRGIT